MVQIDIKRVGFPVKIGSLELWFDSSVENVAKFNDMEKLAVEKARETEKKAAEISFPSPEELETNTPTDGDFENLNKAIGIYREFIAAQYDILFGDGTFKKIYEEYPDIWSLESALPDIKQAIVDKIDEIYDERIKRYESIENEYLSKKANKRK